MSSHSRQAQPESPFGAAIAALARPGDLRCLSLPALHLVMSMRLFALFERAERDPLSELATRLGNVTAARAVLDLEGAITSAWPDPYCAARPCCLRMTHDEQTVQGMVVAAEARSFAEFRLVLAGLVRSDRHERLFDLTIPAVAALQGIQLRA